MNTSGSSSGEVRRKHKSKTKEKHNYKHKSSKSAKSGKEKKDKKEKSKKDKHKKDKGRKRDRAEDRSPDGRPGRLEFGSYGVMRESDYQLKRPEFTAWASEIKHIDIESLPRCVLQGLITSIMLIVPIAAAPEIIPQKCELLDFGDQQNIDVVCQGLCKV